METLLLLAPLLAALISGLTWRWVGELAATITATALMGLAVLVSLRLLWGFDGDAYVVTLGTGLRSGLIEAPWALNVDGLAIFAAVLSLSVSFLAQLFCLGFTAPGRHFTEDETYRPRLIALISLSALATLIVLFSGNWVQLIAGWEAVLAASYLLIGFYFRKPAAASGAQRAVVLGRVSSLALILAAALAFATAESLMLSESVSPNTEGGATLHGWIGGLITLVILMQMAQLVAQVWSLDAMEAPAPGAWVILVGGWGLAALVLAIKLSPLLDLDGLAGQVLTLAGIGTAIYASSAAVAQVDLRRIIGYLAAAQFGVIVTALGLGAPHLALALLTGLVAALGALILGLAALMQRTGAMVNLRQLGAMKARAPTAFWTMLLGALALSGIGVPLGSVVFAGLAAASSQAALFELASGAGLPIAMGLALAAGLSSFAAWRMVFSAFLGRSRGDKQGGAEPADLTWTMKSAIYVTLAAGLGLGVMGPAISSHLAAMTGAPAISPPAAFSFWASAPAFLGLIALALAWYFYLQNPNLSRRLRDNQEALARFFLNGWYLERGLEIGIAQPSLALGRLLRTGGERQMLDGGTHWLAQSLVPRLGRGLMRGQASALYNYAFPAVLGVVLVIALISFRALN
ncbi:MAG: proton-conducting transporter membrane subunit [Pseudomonadota bacterium]